MADPMAMSDRDDFISVSEHDRWSKFRRLFAEARARARARAEAEAEAEAALTRVIAMAMGTDGELYDSGYFGNPMSMTTYDEWSDPNPTVQAQHNQHSQPVNASKGKQIGMFPLPNVEVPDQTFMTNDMSELARVAARYRFFHSSENSTLQNNDGTQNISRDAQKVVYKPFVFNDPNVSIEDPFDQDNWKQTYYTLPHKNLNHRGTGRTSVLTCTGKSSKSMDVDPYDAQVSKQQHNEEINWKDLNRSCESLAQCFDELRFPTGGRFEAMRELIRIAGEHDGDTIMKRSSVTFADKDMVVAGELNQPLYVAAKINGFDIMAMMNNGSFVNLMPFSTFKAACIPEKSLVPETLSIAGVTGKGNTLGRLTVDLQVGPIRSETLFYVIDTNMACHVLLGRPWIHKFEGVASTYHQCFKGKFKGKEVVIKASQTPFESCETHLLVPFFRKSPNPSGEPPCPVWDGLVRVTTQKRVQL